MLFIVEGIDRVGKTTLCERFIKQTNIKYYNWEEKIKEFDVKKLDNINETRKFLHILKLCKLTNANIVFDRFYFTDFVYGCIERGYNFTKALENFKLIEQEMLNLKTFIIFVKPTDIQKSSEQHGKNLIEYQGLFEYLYNISKVNKMECDYYSLWKAENEMKNKLQKSILG